MIPSTRLAVLLVPPAALAVAWVFQPALLAPMFVLDGAVLVLALVDGLLSGGSVRARRVVASIQAVGRPFPVTLVVGNTGGRALDVVVDDDAPGEAPALPARARVAAGTEVALAVQRTLHVRGLHALGSIAVRWRSPLGLWSRQVRVPAAGSLRVYPDFTFLRQASLRARLDEARQPVRARRRPGGESEFLRLRPYVAGDAYRHVDWKATARRQSLVTREFGQESAQNVVLMLDTGRAMTMQHGERVAFDDALHAALALGHGALRHGDRVGLLAFDREVRAWSAPKGGRNTATRLVQATYDVFPRLEEPDPALAFRYLAARVRRRSLVVLLTAATDAVSADALGAVVRALAGRHLPLVVWLTDPRFEALAADPSEDPFVRGAAADLVLWRERTLAGWRAAGALVVDTKADDLSASLLSRYLEIKARRLL